MKTGVSVSYTHLDVYKRQTHDWPQRARDWRKRFCKDSNQPSRNQPVETAWTCGIVVEESADGAIIWNREQIYPIHQVC